MITYGTVFGHWKLLGRSDRVDKRGHRLLDVICLICNVVRRDTNSNLIRFVDGRRDPDRALACRCTRPDYDDNKKGNTSSRDRNGSNPQSVANDTEMATEIQDPPPFIKSGRSPI